VGLHFAGSDVPERGLAIDLQAVLDALNVDLAIDRPPVAARSFMRVPAARSAPAAVQQIGRQQEEVVSR
jgi:endonuclease G